MRLWPGHHKINGHGQGSLHLDRMFSHDLILDVQLVTFAFLAVVCAYKVTSPIKPWPCLSCWYRADPKLLSHLALQKYSIGTPIMTMIETMVNKMPMSPLVIVTPMILFIKASCLSLRVGVYLPCRTFPLFSMVSFPRGCPVIPLSQYCL